MRRYLIVILSLSLLALSIAVELVLADPSDRHPVPCVDPSQSASPSHEGSPHPSESPSPEPPCPAPSASSSPSPRPSPTPSDKQISARSRVSISYDGVFFRGTVTSRRDECAFGRKVLLKKQRRSGAATVGRDKTNEEGNWRIRAETLTGRFVAVAAREVRQIRPNLFLLCRRAESSDSIVITGG